MKKKNNIPLTDTFSRASNADRLPVSILNAVDIKKQEQEIEEEHKHHVLGSSSESLLIKRILGSGGEPELGAFKGTKLEFRDRRDKYGDVTYSLTYPEVKGKKQRPGYEIKIANYKKVVTKQDQSTKKVLNYILVLYNEQKSDTLHFTLQDIVDLGMFGNKDSARRGLNKGVGKLTEVHLTTTVMVNGKPETRYFQFIKEAEIADKSFIEVSPILFDNLSLYYRAMPTWGWGLNSKPYDLLDYIYIRARQSINSIRENGTFNISVQAISEHLGQKLPKETHRISQQIVDPIIDAIEKIEEAQRKHKMEVGNSIYLGINPNYPDDYKSAHDYYLRGYVTITLDEYTRKNLTDLGQKRDKKKKTKAKRIEKLTQSNVEKSLLKEGRTSS